ncbi:MAG: hypothetical protein H6767_01355 [Candidatus Peribacteria bacterium]|nr:MAG: hypothetical protein H6767_01355 [Candidatus Peribacteria bacterium]
MKATTIIVNNTPTHYYASETVDTENCLLFLHGWGQDGKSFEAMYRLLEEKDISYI